MGSKSKTENKVPAYIEQGGQEAINRARQIADMGYVPYIGPDVAMPGQGTLAAWENQNQGANAFGMAAPTGTGLEGLPVANAGGVQGFSSFPAYRTAVENLKQQYPALYAYLASMTRDPITGAGPTGIPGQGEAARPLTAYDRVLMMQGRAPSVAARGQSGGRASDWNRDRPAGSGGNLSFGGYTSVRDMVDGGGPGASGGAFSGGGLISKAANAVTGGR